MSGVGSTAFWIACARAAESVRDAPLFVDELAMAYAERTRAGLLAEFRQRPNPMFDVFAVRTKFFDDYLVAATARCTQVVIAAAGLDSRAFRLALPADCRLFELDLPDMIETKEALLRDCRHLRPVCRRDAVAADLSADWITPLLAAGFRPDRSTAWLVEGFLYYLSSDTSHSFMTAIAELSGEHGTIGLEHVNKDFYRAPWTQRWLAEMQAAGHPWRSGVAEPENWLAHYGWAATVREPGQLPESDGRLVPRTPPRDTPGAARTWLVTATADR